MIMTELPKTDKFPTHNATKKTARHLPVFLALCFVVTPLIIAAAYTSLELFRDLHTFTLSRRETIAFLVATTLKEKLDRVIDVGTSLSTRVQFQKFVEAEKWDEAIKILERVPQDFTYIDRVTLFDPQGILKAATMPTPELLSVFGKDFSYRDYYQGISKNWEPYVAEAIKPAVPLGYNLVPVVLPIKSESNKILGIMLLIIKLDTVAAWSKNIDVGPAGFVYIVDRKGHLVAHPTLLPAEDIIDFSSVLSVQKVLKGEKGVEIIFNQIENEERLTAYEPVPQYGWGAIVVQPTRTAFVERNKAIGRMGIIWTLVIFAVGLFTYRLLRDRTLIEAQRDRERMLLGSIGDGVVAIDRFWNIASWNKAAGELTGWTEKEALGRPFRDVVKFVRESDRKENITFIEETMLFGKVHFMENHTLLVRKDGKEISVGDSAAPVFDQNGQVAGAIVVFRDVSKEYELEKTHQEFSSLATHQLRAPITVIKGYIEMLTEKESSLTEEQRVALGEIRKANETLGALANAMLNVSRIESSGFAIAPEPVYLPDLADGVVKEMSSQIEEKKLKLEKQYGADVPSINADPKLSAAIFRNLLSNAVKYTPQKGTITLKIEKQESDILITISDTGLGIPKAQQSKLFSKFFRADNVRDGKTEGTGLGLYIVKSIVEQAGGKIRFESEENIGTTFFITIPLSGMKKKEGMKGLT